jgi:hypothetical protein
MTGKHIDRLNQPGRGRTAAGRAVVSGQGWVRVPGAAWLAAGCASAHR